MVAHLEHAIGIRREHLVAADHRPDQRLGWKAESLDRAARGWRLLLHDHF